MFKSIPISLNALSKVSGGLLFYLSMISPLAILLQLFIIPNSALTFTWLIFLTQGILLVAKNIRFKLNNFRSASFLITGYFIVIIAIQLLAGHEQQFDGNAWMYAGILSLFFMELTKAAKQFKNFYFNPTLLFVFSFLLLILIGTLLLLLPAATVGPKLSVVDALFMSSSAVCITGLSVLDVSARLSHFGQWILLILVQLGGLGMLTFTGFFGYFFSGGFSYKTQLMYTELLSENKLAAVIQSLLKIIFITFLIEAIGALLIYFSINQQAIPTPNGRVFFAVFHAVSSFCNAGFSILPDGLYHSSIRFNYVFQFIIALLFIVGGLGFGIVLNAYQFVKRWIRNFYLIFRFDKPFVYRAWVISFNSRLVIWTTFGLLLIGTLGIFALEFNRSLAEHKGLWAKLAGAFFMGASPRTAGFNAIDMSLLSLPAVIFIMLLMWIGASPGSTGGGIKTSTFAVAIMNFISLAKGKDRVEAFGREIGMDSVRRSSSIIFLSILGLGLTIFGLSITDSNQNLLLLAFESVSAFSTVGLSLGVTPHLSDGGRIILAICMFIGRVGTLTFIIAFIKKTSFKSYRYPQEKVLY